MTEQNKKTTACPACQQPVDGIDNYCRRCGRVLRSGIVPPQPAGGQASPYSSKKASSAAFRGASPQTINAPRCLRDNPWIVVGLLFLVVGPFGLPMLWMSRGFSYPMKIVLTVLVLGITVYVIWYLYQAYVPLFEILDDLNRV